MIKGGLRSGFYAMLLMMIKSRIFPRCAAYPCYYHYTTFWPNGSVGLGHPLPVFYRSIFLEKLWSYCFMGHSKRLIIYSCIFGFSTYCTGRRNSSVMEWDTVGLMVWRIMLANMYEILIMVINKAFNFIGIQCLVVNLLLWTVSGYRFNAS